MTKDASPWPLALSLVGCSDEETPARFEAARWDQSAWRWPEALGCSAQRMKPTSTMWYSNAGGRPSPSTGGLMAIHRKPAGSIRSKQAVSVRPRTSTTVG